MQHKRTAIVLLLAIIVGSAYVMQRQQDQDLSLGTHTYKTINQPIVKDIQPDVSHNAIPLLTLNPTPMPTQEQPGSVANVDTGPLLSKNYANEIVAEASGHAKLQPTREINPKPSTTSVVYAKQLDLAGYYFTDSPHTGIFGRAFLPFKQNSDNVFYADIRGIIKQHNAKEGNLGLGCRHLSFDQKNMLGGYAFYDRQRTTTGSYFSQFTLGAEVWRDRWFLGANFYMPVGARSVSTNSTSAAGSLVSNGSGSFNILVTSTTSTSTDVAMVGGDLTAAYQPTDSLTGYIGGFYYHRATKKFDVPILLGPFARVRYSFFPSAKLACNPINEISFESQIQYDQVRHTVWYAGIRLTFAVGGSRLNRMQQHMVDPALRDINIVSTNNKTVTQQQQLATTNGRNTNVTQVSSNTDVNSAIGNTNVDVIAVQGTIANANPTSTTLATGQTLTGGMYTFNYNGQMVSVQVSSGGELQSTSGSTNLIKVGKNNTVRDIKLTMVGATNTNGSNVAILGDSSVNALGTLEIDNVTSNGIISVPRSGSTQSATVNIVNSTFDIGTVWAPTNIPAIGQFDLSNSASLTITVDNSKLISNSTKEIVGLRVQCQTSSSATVTGISNSNINGSDAGIVLGASGGTITVTGDIANNVIDGGSATDANETGLLIFGFSSNPSTFIMNGAIKNNTITGSDDGLDVVNFGGSAVPTFHLNGGIINNTITGNREFGINISPNSATQGTITITNFYGNTVHGTSPNADIKIIGPHTTIQVGQGNTGLSAANHGASLNVSGSPTITPSQ